MSIVFVKFLYFFSKKFQEKEKSLSDSAENVRREKILVFSPAKHNIVLCKGAQEKDVEKQKIKTKGDRIIMSSYRLIVKFPKEALNAIYAAGEMLAITKEVAGNKGKSVTWVATSPFEVNTIEWEEEYLLYSSRQETQSGARISKLSEEQAVSAILYQFENAVFQNAKAADEVGKNEYGVQNAMDMYPYLSFGLAQPVRVNDELQMGNPINAITLPYNHIAVMSPKERVKIFLAANVDNGVVITKEFSNAIEIEYEGSVSERTIEYDCQKGIFIPA